MKIEALEAMAESLFASAHEIDGEHIKESILLDAWANALDAAAKEKRRLEKIADLKADLLTLGRRANMIRVWVKVEVPILPKARRKHIEVHKQDLRAIRRAMHKIKKQLAELQA